MTTEVFMQYVPNNPMLDEESYILILQHLQASPKMFTFIDEAIADELVGARLFDISECRITAKAVEFLTKVRKS